MTDPKHISQLDPARRAMIDQATRDCLLAIVMQQGKAVTFPLDVLNAASESHRLIIEVDRAAGVVTLSTERAETIIQG